MRKAALVGGTVAVLMLANAPGAMAGPWEDGMAAYNRGDYVPAIRLFRPMAEQGNPKAQGVLGVMYRKGEGVPRNLGRAYMWFSLAARRGDVRGKAGLRTVSHAMTPAEVSRAQEMVNACEASNYRNCEY